MKKTLLLLSLMIASVMSVNAQGGYRGFFEVTPSVGSVEFNLDITTTHGWQLDDKFYVGLGCGVLNLLEPDSYTYYGLAPGELGIESEENVAELAIPVFAKFRYDKLGVNRLTPFVEAKLGYCVVCEKGTPLYAGLSVGARYAITERIGLNLGIGVSLTPYSCWVCEIYNARYVGDYGTDYWWDWEYDSDYERKAKTSMNFAVTLGVDF